MKWALLIGMAMWGIRFILFYFTAAKGIIGWHLLEYEFYMEFVMIFS